MEEEEDKKKRVKRLKTLAKTNISEYLRKIILAEVYQIEKEIYENEGGNGEGF